MGGGAGRSDAKYAPQEVNSKLKEVEGYLPEQLVAQFGGRDSEYYRGGSAGDKRRKLAHGSNRGINSYNAHNSNALAERGRRGKVARKWRVDIGPERFLAPEVFFSPETYSKKFLYGEDSIQATVDRVVQACPIDYRRALY